MFARKVLHGAGWMALSGYFNLIVSFLGNIVLARILFPDDFGTYAFAISIVMLVFFPAAFGSAEAIVQSRHDHLADLIPTAYWMTFFLSLLLATAGTIAGLVLRNQYESLVIQMIVVLSWSRFFHNVTTVHRAILQRDFVYRPIAVSYFLSNAAAFAAAIGAALLGAGAWSIVIRDLVLIAIQYIGLRWSSGFKLTFTFDRQTARWIWGFGLRMMSYRVNEFISFQVDKLVVGASFGTSILGHYSLASRLSYLGDQFTQGAVQPVLFSTFSAIQNNPERLQFSFERMNYWLIRGAFFLGLSVWISGENLVLIIYGEKWDLAAQIFQVMFLSLALLPLLRGYQEFLVGSGNIDSAVRARMAQLVFFFPAIFAAARWFDIITVVWMMNATMVFGFALMVLFAVRVVRINWIYLMRGPLFGTVIGATLGITITQFVLTNTSLLVTTVVQLFVIAASYLLSLFIIERRTLLAEWRIVYTRLT